MAIINSLSSMNNILIECGVTTGRLQDDESLQPLEGRALPLLKGRIQHLACTPFTASFSRLRASSRPEDQVVRSSMPWVDAPSSRQSSPSQTDSGDAKAPDSAFQGQKAITLGSETRCLFFAISVFFV